MALKNTETIIFEVIIQKWVETNIDPYPRVDPRFPNYYRWLNHGNNNITSLLKEVRQILKEIKAGFPSILVEIPRKIETFHATYDHPDLEWKTTYIAPKNVMTKRQVVQYFQQLIKELRQIHHA